VASSPKGEAEGEMGGNGLAGFIGLRVDGPGVARLRVTRTLLNGSGLLLGPVGFALVDFTMGSAVWPHRNEGESIATISITINYVQGAREGEELVCRAQLDRRNRHTAVLSANVHNEQGALRITAIGSFAIYVPRPADAGRTAPQSS
jgi:uncharacterized protein (TIGR00369 family)